MLLIFRFRSVDHNGVVPRLSNRRKFDKAASVISGICAYTRFSDMLGRAGNCCLTKIDSLSNLCEVMFSNGLPSSSANARVHDALDRARLKVHEYLDRVNAELSSNRCIEARGEATCVWFAKSAEFLESKRRSGVNDLFTRLLVKDNIRSVSTEVVRAFSVQLTDILWLLLRRLSLMALGVKSLTSFFQVNVFGESQSLIRLLAMAAWCEQTLTTTLTFGELIGVPTLTRGNILCGWENPFKALDYIKNYHDELKLAQLSSYNQIRTETSKSKVSLSFFYF